MERMPAWARGLVAALLWYGGIFAAPHLGVQDGNYVLMLAGAMLAGYWVGSGWALLLALPIFVYGFAAADESGPLENTDDGWGIVVMLAFGLPVAGAAIVGALLRYVTHREKPGTAGR